MPVKDTFLRMARWDSVGLDCLACVYQRNADEWPNRKRDYACGLHRISLDIELGPDGYKQGEWFCKDFQDNGRAHPTAVEHFHKIRDHLKPHVLYRLEGEGKYLSAYPFEQLKRTSDGDRQES